MQKGEERRSGGEERLVDALIAQPFVCWSREGAICPPAVLPSKVFFLVLRFLSGNARVPFSCGPARPVQHKTLGVDYAAGHRLARRVLKPLSSAFGHGSWCG